MADENIVEGNFVAHVPIEWCVPDNLMSAFASNIIVQRIENSCFKISFFEIKPPMLLDDSAPPPSKIRADCVASVIITPDKLTKFIAVLQRQLDKYMEIKEKN